MKKDEHLLSVSEFKNILKQQSSDDLIDLLVDCFKVNSQIKEYVTAKYAGQDTMEQIFATYKNKVHDVFFPRNMRAQLKIGDARKAVIDFKKICSDGKLVLDLMLYYLEMGVEFTNTYGDIGESFYNSMERMYQSIIREINKHKTPEIYNMLSKRLKAVVDDTGGIGWGFHDYLSDMYHDIKWLDAGDIDCDLNDLEKIKTYIALRLGKRKKPTGFDSKLSIEEIVSKIIDADEIFLDKMDKQRRGYSNDEEYDFIARKTGFDIELIELVLWQRYCYEMENDYWQYTEGKCKKCRSNKLYLKEVPGEDYADRVVCKECGTEFSRD